jgi:hypothetical protein
VDDVGWATDVTLGGDEAWVMRRVGWGLRGVTGLWCLGMRCWMGHCESIVLGVFGIMDGSLMVGRW